MGLAKNRRSLSLIFVLAVGIIIVSPFKVFGGQTVISSFPYTVTTNDNYDTLTLASSYMSASGRLLTFSNDVHDVYLNFASDTLVWGTAGDANLYGIWLAANNLYNITLDGGVFLHNPPPQMRTPNVLLRARAIRLGGLSHDITIKNAYFSIYGRNSQMIYTEGGEYNMEIADCTFDDHKESFTQRDMWGDAAMIAIMNQSAKSNSDFQFDYKIHGCTTLQSYWCNLYLHGDGMVMDVYNNYFIVDARNDFDSAGAMYGSAGQCYAVSIRGNNSGASVVKFHDNTIRSGTNYAGGRGIFISAIHGASLDPDNSVNIYNNDILVHQGFDEEYTTLNGIIVRQAWANVILRGNTVVCVGDTSQGLGNSYGPGPISGIRLTTGVGGEHGLHIIGNTIKTYFTGNWVPNYSMGGDGLFAACIMFDEFAMNVPDVVVDSNWFESNNVGIKWGFGNGQGGNITGLDNYFSSHDNRIDYTFFLGDGWISTRHAYDNWFINCNMEGTATDTSIYMADYESDSLSIGLRASLLSIVYGNNSLPVPGATVWVTNAYGDLVGQGMTDSNGLFSQDVTYWWECNATFGIPDSTSFNNFTVKAKKGNDSTTVSYAVSSANRYPLVVLANTAGEQGQSDVIPPSPIDNLIASPASLHGEIALSWTAPGDDGDSGVASYYVIKYSNSVINEFNFQSAASVSNPPVPGPAGQTENFTITGLNPGQSYYIAIKTYDESNNVSPISNVPASFAAGIESPNIAGTFINSNNMSAELMAYTVDSYMALDYEFELDTVITFPDPSIDYGLLADTVSSVVFGNLSPDVSYYWKCRAIASNNSDSSDWSAPINFNVLTGVSDILSQSDCIYPLAGQTIDTENPVFLVRYIEGISHIYFRVDTNPEFAAPVESGAVTTVAGQNTSWQMPTDIIAGLTYYWEISADNQVWTAPMSFTAILDIHPYPNPFRVSSGHSGVVFTNLIADSDIVIATSTGEIVFEADGVGPGEWSWDVRNKSGSNVASGVYLYHVGYPSGTASGKLVVIR